jgi:hypothetical protein
MQIYSSTEYIKDKVVGDLQLEVNSQWKFNSRDVCFKTIYAGAYNETIISYNLKECIEVITPTHTRWRDAEITPEIVEELTRLGYQVIDNLDK